jgi:CMP/dCMP kinase
MKAIILCGMPAVGKTTVAKIIASELGLKLIGGGDILKEIAIEEGYNAVGDDWWDTEEGMRFMKERAGSPEFDKEVDRRLLARAQKSDVVITSYTLPWLAKDGVKVWLSGTKKSRGERMAKRDSSSPEEVAKVIEERDRKNYALYKNLYGMSFGKDLSPFNLVVGTDGVPAAKVAEEVLGQLKKLEKAPKPSTPRKPGSRKVGGRRRSS